MIVFLIIDFTPVSLSLLQCKQMPFSHAKSNENFEQIKNLKSISSVVNYANGILVDELMMMRDGQPECEHFLPSSYALDVVENLNLG